MKAQVVTLSLVALITASCPAQSPSFFQPFPQRPKLFMRAGANDQIKNNAQHSGWQENWSTESPYSSIHYDLKPAKPAAALAPAKPSEDKAPQRPAYLPSTEKSPGK